MTAKILWLICVGALAVSCSPISKQALNKSFKSSEARFQDHIGFMLYDPAKQKSIYEYNSAKYFTPASNTKIFTFYTALTTIGDSVPALKYVEHGDSLIVWGTGDPSFLYNKVFNTDRVLSFLQKTGGSLYFSSNNYQTTHLGNGWAWDDYNDYYSAERSAFPVYGNLLYLSVQGDSVNVQPSYYSKFLTYSTDVDKHGAVRNTDSNIITIFKPLSNGFNTELPARMDDDVAMQLLADTLRKNVKRINMAMPKSARILYSEPADSLYKVMMQESDNFVAEQLLLVCAGILSDTLKPEIAISYMKANALKDLQDEPLWVDGSGLSRYNLFTPRSVVQLWQKIYTLVPRERLFPLLATGGKAGTIRNWYKADSPYIYGKTGSLSNNHCLSGYLVTREGKTLIFSFMNSNFTAPSSEVRKNMQNILKLIYEKY